MQINKYFKSLKRNATIMNTSSVNYRSMDGTFHWKMIRGISIFIIAAMVSTVGVSLILNQHQPNAASYQWGNESVQFNGKNVVLGFGNHRYPVEWKIFKVNLPKSIHATPSSSSGLISYIKNANYSYNRIFNSYQNSAVMNLYGPSLKVSEVYSFNSNGIDASLAIDNLGNSTGYYFGTITLHTKSHRIGYLQGDNPRQIKQNIGFQSSAYHISTNDWQFCQGNVSINWHQELSIFHSGTLISNKSGSAISLPFGPVSISPNEVYSIDPLISPMTISGGGAGQTASTVNFNETGLPSGKSWSVTFNGASHSSTTSTISFNEVTGNTYAYYMGTMNGFYSTPSSGHITVGNTVYTKMIKFSPESQAFYSVTFVESGLPPGTAWSLTLNGQEKSSSSSSISFLETTGIYSYFIPDANGLMGTYSASANNTAYGNVTVGANTGNQSIHFNFHLSRILYLASFTEHNLPLHTLWAITLKNQLTGYSISESASSGSSINFTQVKGTYTYSTTINPQSKGSEYMGKGGTVTLSGNNANVIINYMKVISYFNLTTSRENLNYPNFYLAQHGFKFSVTYSNISSFSNAGFILIDAVTASGSAQTIGNITATAAANGTWITQTYIWNDQPGFYRGFEVFIKTGSTSGGNYRNYPSMSISGNYYIFTIFPAAMPYSGKVCYFSDAIAIGKVYNSNGAIIANISQIAASGINCVIQSDSSYGFGYVLGVYTGKSADTKYGVMSETQTVTYANVSSGLIQNNNYPFVCFKNCGNYILGHKGQNTTSAYILAEEEYQSLSTVVSLAGFSSSFNISAPSSGLLMGGFGFYSYKPVSGKSNQYYSNTITSSIRGTIHDINYCSYSSPDGSSSPSLTGYTYIPIKNASGGISTVFGFLDEAIFPNVAGFIVLNYFNYNINVKLIKVSYDPTCQQYDYNQIFNNGNPSPGPTYYGIAMSMPLYIAST